MSPERNALSSEQRQRFAALILLDRIVTDAGAFHAALLEERDDAFLEPTFRYLQQEDLAEVGEDDHFQPTARGREVYRKLLRLRQSYLAHFEIFARVDLETGEFADPEMPHDAPRWDDLRVAICQYKGIDPFRVTFLAMLSDETFFEDREWKFDLALGSNFFAELDEIVGGQISVGDLAYETESGESISGESVIEDVILQGATLNREYWERERGTQESFLEEPFDNGDAAEAESGDGEAYDPWEAMEYYAASAQYVEPIWLEELW